MMCGKIRLAVVLVFSAALAGCNTVAGMGEDMSQAGRAISDAAMP